MQWNCTSPFLQNIGYDPFSVSKAPSYPQIIGEGDVSSVILPDGTIQLYFVPTNRHVTLSPFQYNIIFPNLHCTANKDIWFVRSISHPLPPSLWNRPIPDVYGDQQPPTQFNPNFCINSPPHTDYCQKFHNDDSSSTTDIHYFYPSLCNTGCLKYSTETQTEPFAINNTNALDRCPDLCGCKNAETVVKNNLNTKSDASASSTSYMSVDSASKLKHRLSKRNKKKSKANKSSDQNCYCDVENKKYKYNKSRDHSCHCNVETKKLKYKSNKSRHHSCHCDVEVKKSNHKSRDPLCKSNSEKKLTSDKLITTFAEKASGSTVKDGRHTQTVEKKSKQSDISIELWEPIPCTCGERFCRCSSSGTDDN